MTRPVGDAADPPRYLRDGDRVEAEVEVGGIGTLTNPVVAERHANVSERGRRDRGAM